MNDKQLKKLALFADSPELALHQELVELNDNLVAFKEALKEKRKIMAELKGVDFAQIKGDQGKQGIQGQTGEQGPQGKKGQDSKVPGPKGEIGLPGLNGKDGRDGIDGKEGAPGKDGSPDSPEQLVEKLESLQDNARLDISAIKNVDKLEERINKKISAIPRGGGGAKHSTKFYKLTADGSTKTFTVPKSVTSIVLMSDFPHVLFEGSANGFTINTSRTSITLTTDTAPSVGSQLLYQYSEMFST